MRLGVSPTSRVYVELRATGLLKAVGHDPTLVARPEPGTIEATEGTLDLPVALTFPVDAFEMPLDVGPSDREKMRDNMRSREVLDADRHPRVEARGRYLGTLEGGRFEGELVVRGNARPLALDLRVAREGSEYALSGTWEGRLNDLGVKPFKALLGALRLEDWVRLRCDLRLTPA